MKTYQKPKLIALSISGNSPLCACAVDIVGENADQMYQDMIKDFPPPENAFATGDGCDYAWDVGGYCKHSPSPENVVINS